MDIVLQLNYFYKGSINHELSLSVYGAFCSVKTQYGEVVAEHLVTTEMASLLLSLEKGDYA